MSLAELISVFEKNRIAILKGPALLTQLAKKAKPMNYFGKVSDVVKEMQNDYKSYLLGLRLSESTITTYSVFIIDFLKFIAGKQIETVNNTDVRLFIEQQVKLKQYSISTHRQLVSAIKHFGKLYMESEIVVEDIQRPYKSTYLPTVLSKEEMLEILRATRNLKHRATLALLYSSGLRIGEVIDLKLSCIDLDRRQIFVRNGKGRKDRVVVMAESFVYLFKNYFMTYRPEVYFIESPKGGPYDPGSVRSFLKDPASLPELRSV